MSPMQNTNVVPIMSAIMPLGTTDQMRAFGSTMPASRTSSPVFVVLFQDVRDWGRVGHVLMWTAQS